MIDPGKPETSPLNCAKGAQTMERTLITAATLVMDESESGSVDASSTSMASTASETEASSTLPSTLASDTSFSDGQGSLSDDDEGLSGLKGATHDPLGNPAVSKRWDHQSFMKLRATYLLVTLVIMLADGLQGTFACRPVAGSHSFCEPSLTRAGTHLYVLYEGYGFSVAHLYSLGFAAGGLLSPTTGPLVDRIGRKRSAILYCLLEIFINILEQYPFLSGLIASRMIGGFTTNLLSSVFETWLDTEYRKRGFAKEKYEIIMRDSVIVSNSAAILSGYLAHVLADHYDAVGPFRGAVTFTAVALVVVCLLWNENYGSSQGQENQPQKSMVSYFREAVTAFRQDHRMLRVGLLQGLTAGSLQIFVYLWSPTLRHFASSALSGSVGLDKAGQPAYGLIFGTFMGAGVLGGLLAPRVRRWVASWRSHGDDAVPVEVECLDDHADPSVGVVTSLCYLVSSFLLFVPSMCSDDSPSSFSLCLLAFVAYEVMIGMFLPCEGVIRSMYFPTEARASIMALPRLIVNVAVTLGVASTEYLRYVVGRSQVGRSSHNPQVLRRHSLVWVA